MQRWVQASQVVFHPAKESFRILSRTQGYGDNFSLLGVDFDVQLLMHSAIHQCAIAAGWRVRSLLRAQNFVSTSDAIMMFKSQVLSYIESCTAGIAHASTTTLAPLDNVQKHVLHLASSQQLQMELVKPSPPLKTKRAQSTRTARTAGRYDELSRRRFQWYGGSFAARASSPTVSCHMASAPRVCDKSLATRAERTVDD